MIPEPVRAWIYRVFTAASFVLLFYGVVTDTEWAAWTAAVNALLGSGILPTLNTSTRRNHETGTSDTVQNPRRH